VGGPLTYLSLSAAISNDTLTLGGAGGARGAGYTLLTSTNLALPMSKWTTNTTGVFSSTGAYSVVIKIDASTSDHFFEIRSP
jgi:hypothetical protein